MIFAYFMEFNSWSFKGRNKFFKINFWGHFPCWMKYLWVKFDSMGNVLMIQRTYFIQWDNTCSVTMPAICKCKYGLLWAKHFYHHEYPDHCLFSFKYSNHCIVVSSGFYRCLFDQSDILSAIWGLYHYHPLSPASVSMCYRGWSGWWIWITRCVGNGALDRAGINNDSQFTQFTLNIC